MNLLTMLIAFSQVKTMKICKKIHESWRQRMNDAELQAPTNEQQANNEPNDKLNESTNVKSYTHRK